MFFVPSEPGENRGERLGEFESRSVKTRYEFSLTLPSFSRGYEGTDNISYFFYIIIIFSVNEEKDDKRSPYCKLSLLGDSQTTLLTPFSCFIRYENTLVDQSKRTYYPNYFIIANQTC